jgi:hypothetical protein
MAEQQPAGRNLICQIGHGRASLRTGTGKSFVVGLLDGCGGGGRRGARRGVFLAVFSTLPPPIAAS